MFKEYVDFEIEIQQQRGISFPFTVSSPGGDASGKLRLPTDDPVYQQLILRLGMLDTNEAMLGQIGQILFKALFQGKVKEVYAGSQAMLQENQGLRMKLNIAASESEVAALPWELLNDPDRGPLALLDMPVVRYLPQPIRIPKLKVELPLKVLLTGAQIPPLANIERELTVIAAALSTMGRHVQYVVEPHLTTSILRKRLREGFHVWHFVGHGGFTDDDTTATLLFEDETGDRDRVSATQLGIMLNRSSVRLILLDACESGKLATDPFRSIAPALIRAQVPAVVAMQFPVSQDSTRAFAGEFYRTLTEGFPIDACVTEARKSVMDVSGLRSPDWGIPVVYTRAPDGNLFELPPVASGAASATSARDSGINISVESGQVLKDASSINVSNVGSSTVTDIANQDADRAEDIAALQQVIYGKKRRLQQLKLRAAQFGINVPPEVATEIEDLDGFKDYRGNLLRPGEIAKLERELKELGG